MNRQYIEGEIAACKAKLAATNNTTERKKLQNEIAALESQLRRLQ